MQDGPSQAGQSVVGVRQRKLKKIWRPLGEGSLTIITIMQDGLSRVQRFVIVVRKRKHRKSMETLKRGVSDRHNDYARWTVVSMTVRRRCPLEDTWKK